MKSLRWLGPLGICVAVVAFAVPGDAPAQRGPAGSGGGPAAFITLDGSDGYDVLLLTVGKRVLLEVGRGRVAAAYLVPGRVSANGIAARFGNLGQVDVTFRPLGGRERKDGCRRRALQVGFFVGTIRFRGERGYTRIATNRALGLLLDPRPKRCGRRAVAAASARSRRELNTHLTAISRQRRTVTSFELSRLRGQTRLRLEAARQERRGKMEIFRQSSTVIGGKNAFISSGPAVRPPFAFVVAPKPFSGRALFDGSAAPGPTWTGNLAAWLPGAGKVALTGPEYASSFCRRASDEPGCNPEPPVRSPLSALQGSGSQSQLFAEARLSWSRYLRNSASSAGSTP